MKISTQEVSSPMEEYTNNLKLRINNCYNNYKFVIDMCLYVYNP